MAYTIRYYHYVNVPNAADQTDYKIGYNIGVTATTSDNKTFNCKYAGLKATGLWFSGSTTSNTAPSYIKYSMSEANSSDAYRVSYGAVSGSHFNVTVTAKSSSSYVYDFSNSGGTIPIMYQLYPINLKLNTYYKQYGSSGWKGLSSSTLDSYGAKVFVRTSSKVSYTGYTYSGKVTDSGTAQIWQADYSSTSEVFYCKAYANGYSAYSAYFTAYPRSAAPSPTSAQYISSSTYYTPCSALYRLLFMQIYTKNSNDNTIIPSVSFTTSSNSASYFYIGSACTNVSGYTILSAKTFSTPIKNIAKFDSKGNSITNTVSAATISLTANYQYAPTYSSSSTDKHIIINLSPTDYGNKIIVQSALSSYMYIMSAETQHSESGFCPTYANWTSIRIGGGVVTFRPNFSKSWDNNKLVPWIDMGENTGNIIIKGCTFPVSLNVSKDCLSSFIYTRYLSGA